MELSREISVLVNKIKLGSVIIIIYAITDIWNLYTNSETFPYLYTHYEMYMFLY